MAARYRIAVYLEQNNARVYVPEKKRALWPWWHTFSFMDQGGSSSTLEYDNMGEAVEFINSVRRTKTRKLNGWIYP